MKIGKNVSIDPSVKIFTDDIEIGDNVRIDAFCILTGKIRIGSHVHIGAGCYLFGKSGIVIEDFVGISAQGLLYSESDDYSGESLTNPTVSLAYKPIYQRGKITLKRHAILGARCTVLPGVTVHEGAAVGAHSLITTDMDEWSISVGTPAKNIKVRSRKMLDFEKEFLG